MKYIFFFKLASRQGCIFLFYYYPFLHNNMLYIIFCLAWPFSEPVLNPFFEQVHLHISCCQRLLFQLTIWVFAMPPEVSSIWVVAFALMPPEMFGPKKIEIRRRQQDLNRRPLTQQLAP